MLSTLIKHSKLSTSAIGSGKKLKVTILGAAGGIGQPLSLLIKSRSLVNEEIGELSLYDISNMGMATDLAHIPTPTKVVGYSQQENLPRALKGSDIVIIPAGIPRKPGMTRDDLFSINASIVKELADQCALNCPKASILIISNPVNSTVPIAWERMRKKGIMNPKVFGVTTLDNIRARTFIGEKKGVNPKSVNIRVIGGHSGPTIAPLFSGATSDGKELSFSTDEIASLTKRIQYGGDEVVKAKDGGGSATLSMAFAAKEFIDSFISALTNPSEKISAFVRLGDEMIKEDSVEYFAGEMSLNDDGTIRKIFQIKENELKREYGEDEMVKVAKDVLKKDIEKGKMF